MTKLWLDCEWNEQQGDLISMALVGESAEWYEVLPCWRPGEWVKKHVIPVLNKEPILREEMQSRLRKFLCQFPSITIIADWPEDIAQFCKLLIVSSGTAISTPPLKFELARIESISALPHNALSDARGIRDAYLKR